MANGTSQEDQDRPGEGVGQQIADLYTANFYLKKEIEERRVLASALQESEEMFRLLIEKAPEAILLYDVKLGGYIEANARAEELFGCNRDVLLRSGPQQFYRNDQPDGRPFSEAVEEHRKQALAGREIVFERWIRRQDREERVIEVRLVGLVSPSRVLIRSSYLDITDRKKAEETLSRHAKTLSILNEVISIASHSECVPLLFEGILRATLRLMDYSCGGIYLIDPHGETASITCSLHLQPDLLEEVRTIPIHKAPYDQLFIRRVPIITNHYEEVAPYRAKKYGILSLASIPLISRGDVIGVLNVASRERHEVTPEEIAILTSISTEISAGIERIRAGQVILQSATNLETLFNSVSELFFILDMEGRIIRANEAACTRLQYTREELQGKNVLFLHVPERQDEALTNVKGMIEGTIDCCPVPVVAKDGTRIEVETHVTRGRWDNKDVLIGVTRDVTERKNAENALRQSEERFRQLFEYHAAVMLLVNPEDGRIIDANNAAVQFYGYSRTQLQDMPISDINILPRDQIHAEYLRAARQSKNEFVFPHRLASGEIRTVEVHSTPITINQQEVLFSIIHDITERRRAEEALAHHMALLANLLDSIPDIIFSKIPMAPISDAIPHLQPIQERLSQRLSVVPITTFSLRKFRTPSENRTLPSWLRLFPATTRNGSPTPMAGGSLSTPLKHHSAPRMVR